MRCCPPEERSCGATAVFLAVLFMGLGRHLSCSSQALVSKTCTFYRTPSAREPRNLGLIEHGQADAGRAVAVSVVEHVKQAVVPKNKGVLDHFRIPSRGGDVESHMVVMSIPLKAVL